MTNTSVMAHMEYISPSFTATYMYAETTISVKRERKQTRSSYL